MNANFDISLALCLRFEGDFSNDPHDSGGATMNGITLAVYREYTGNPNATVANLKAMLPDTRDRIYKERYWDKCYAAVLPDGVDYSVFDMGVNAGTGTSVRLMQEVLEVGVDGIVGPQTMAAIADTDTVMLIGELYARHEEYYKSLNDFVHFGKGWLTRNDARWHGALALLRPPHSRYTLEV